VRKARMASRPTGGTSRRRSAAAMAMGATSASGGVGGRGTECRDGSGWHSVDYEEASSGLDFSHSHSAGQVFLKHVVRSLSLPLLTT
jgi:hypothetical protein